MQVTEIPFVKHLRIDKDAQGNLSLPFNHEMQNHLQTVHASAQFALAETASGEYLQKLFPELVGKVVPLLRDAQVKFKKPAQTYVTAIPSVDETEIETFRNQIEKKGRGSIHVNVTVRDEAGSTSCTATYNWFVTKLE